MRPKILIIEDEPAIAENIIFALSTEGFDPIWKITGREGLAEWAKGKIQLIILDISLPDANGVEICREIRKTSEVPVIFLTARSGEMDKVVGLEIGADDYLVKPFSPRELTARIKAILRRTGPEKKASIQASQGPFQIDESKKCVYYHGKTLALTRNEYSILKILLYRPGQVYSREKIMEMAWESPESSQARTVDAHVKSLRGKLRKTKTGKNPIQTHRGFGYSLKVDA